MEADLSNDDVCPMTWEEVRSLHRRGFSIGAHGVTHAILTRETKARAFSEISGSIAKISAEIGTPCTGFAFPNGNYTPELAQHAVRCGVTTVMTTEPTWVDHTFPFWRLPRVQLCGQHSRGKIALKTALAALGGVLPNPDGTGRIYRKNNKTDGQVSKQDLSSYGTGSREHVQTAAKTVMEIR